MRNFQDRDSAPFRNGGSNLAEPGAGDGAPMNARKARMLRELRDYGVDTGLASGVWKFAVAVVVGAALLFATPMARADMSASLASVTLSLTL